MRKRINNYIKQIFPIQCKGRDFSGNEVLTEPVEVEVKVYKSPGSSTISSEVKCPYNTGGHGQRCNIFYLTGVDKTKKDIFCPYAFDVPYTFEKNDVGDEK